MGAGGGVRCGPAAQQEGVMLNLNDFNAMVISFAVGAGLVGWGVIELLGWLASNSVLRGGEYASLSAPHRVPR